VHGAELDHLALRGHEAFRHQGAHEQRDEERAQDAWLSNPKLNPGADARSTSADARSTSADASGAERSAPRTSDDEGGR
jgi:hypothetical protein